MAPLVRTGGSRHTGLAAPPHRNIQQKMTYHNRGTNMLVNVSLPNITDEAVQKYIKEQAEESRKEDSRSNAL